MTDGAGGHAVRLRTNALTEPMTTARAREITENLPDHLPDEALSATDRHRRRVSARVLWIVGPIAGILTVIAIVATVRSAGWNTPLTWILAGSAAMILGAQVWEAVARRRAVRRRARLIRLAADNDWRLDPVRSDLPLATLFTVGSERTVHDLIHLDTVGGPTIAEYSAEIDAGRSTLRLRLACIRLPLPQRLPHIVLDASANDGVGLLRLSRTYAEGQRLSLEGDFDRHFTLMCPSGYERDALYLFAPDIMSVFLEHAAALDAEIIDDHLLLYGTPAAVTEPTVARWIGTITLIDALERKIAQWDRWRDDRREPYAADGMLPALTRPAPGVSAPGERLRGTSHPDRARKIVGWSAFAVSAIVLALVVAGELLGW